MRLLTHLCRIAFIALAPLPLCAQHGRATVTVAGHVSPVVAVTAGSAAPIVRGHAQVSVSSAGADTLVLSLSGQGGGETRIEIPVQLRSNVEFTLAASCAARVAALSDLSVVGVEGAGKFVYPGATARVEVPALFDGRQWARPQLAGPQDFSSPVTILTGPPISMSGTLDSPGNMIEVVLRIALTAPAGEKDWIAEVKMSARPLEGTIRLRRVLR